MAATPSQGLVFVTGASSGIGGALARSVPFAARVVGICRRSAEGVEHLPADLGEPSAWDTVARTFDATLRSFDGPRAVFVHAAGTLTPMGFAGEQDAVAYRRQVLLNAACPLVLGDAFLRAACRTASPCDLVMITSGAAHSVYEGWSAYGAGKAAVDHWVRTVGAEQSRRGAGRRVVAVAPGVVNTPMQAEIRDTSPDDFPQVERFRALHASGGLRTPEDAAREIWDLLEAGLENGAVVDLRDRRRT